MTDRAPKSARARPLALLTLGLWLGCGSPPPPVPPPAAPDAIEPSGGLEAETLFGAGNTDAERCFERAAAVEAKTPACAPSDECVSRCRTHDFDACAELASALEQAQPACAETLGALTCGAEHPRSCAQLALLLLSRKVRDETRIRKLLDQGCAGGVPRACSRLAALRLEREGAYDAEALQLFERACELGEGGACFEAAAHRQRTHGWYDAESDKLLERGCDLGHEGACMQLGQRLWQRSITGSPERARAEQLLGGVCDGVSPDAGEACFTMAQSMAAVDPKASEAFNEKACQKGHFNACASTVSDHYSDGRYAEAIALSSKLIQESPDHWLPRYTRGMSLFDTGKHAEAAADLALLCSARADWPHCELWLYAARERSQQDGVTGLAEASKKVDLKAWPGPVFRFFLGKLSAQALLALAKDKDPQKQLEQECEAYYYVGQQLLIQGKAKQAKPMFEKAVATQVTNFVEYGSAKAELALLSP